MSSVRGIFLSAALSAFLLTSAAGQENARTTGRSIATLSNVLLRARSGNFIKLGSRVAPGKPTLIAFWASWCPPCIAEAPTLNSIRRHLASRFNFIYVNRSEGDPDPNQPPQAIARLLDRGGLTDVDYVIADVDAYRQIIGPDIQDIPEGKVGIPRVYLFDGRGRQVYTTYGFDPAAGSALEERVRRTMATK